jgi:hypothetical protein
MTDPTEREALVRQALEADPLAALIESVIPDEATPWRFRYSERIAAALRENGYEKREPVECICYSHRSSQCRAHDEDDRRAVEAEFGYLEPVADAAEQIDRLMGWKHLRKHGGMSAEWMDAVRDAIVRITAKREPPFDQYTLREEITALEAFLHDGANPTRANLAWERIKGHAPLSEREPVVVDDAMVERGDVAYVLAMRRDPRPWFAMRAALTAALTPDGQEAGR